MEKYGIMVGRMARSISKMEKATKIKLLRLWEMLSQETDEDHPMGTTTILSRLADMGIDCTRRTLYDDIKVLNEYGYEILCQRGISNEYYVVDKKLDLAELRILLDAIQAASSITEKKTAILVDKLANLGGSKRGEILKKNIVAFNTTKTDNESIFYNVDTINEAIIKRKKIQFYYFDYNLSHERVYRREHKRYVVNPYATVVSNDNYYLLCYNDFHKNIVHYRIDRMEQVLMLEYDMTELKEIDAFDVAKHKKQVFDMFSGEEYEVTFRADNSLMDVVFDKFGSDVNLHKYNDTMFEFKAKIELSNTFWGWCLMFGNKLKIIAPNDIVIRLKNYIDDISNSYKE